ncbi:hypothetical protein SSS_05550 [Sarcoptes scabiei]|uniref:Uncharacterized protein n=1 Tax=Sarcoptes scabiei TaxID=52283 RepID=A0A834R9J2_SARSC|nr:hypothetical protein SSS_05550 [Sarcoptes scabiei]
MMFDRHHHHHHYKHYSQQHHRHPQNYWFDYRLPYVWHSRTENHQNELLKANSNSNLLYNHQHRQLNKSRIGANSEPKYGSNQSTSSSTNSSISSSLISLTQQPLQQPLQINHKRKLISFAQPIQDKVRNPYCIRFGNCPSGWYDRFQQSQQQYQHRIQPNHHHRFQNLQQQSQAKNKTFKELQSYRFQPQSSYYWPYYYSHYYPQWLSSSAPTSTSNENVQHYPYYYSTASHHQHHHQFYPGGSMYQIQSASTAATANQTLPFIGKRDRKKSILVSNRLNKSLRTSSNDYLHNSQTRLITDQPRQRNNVGSSSSSSNIIFVFILIIILIVIGLLINFVWTIIINR